MSIHLLIGGNTYVQMYIQVNVKTRGPLLSFYPIFSFLGSGGDKWSFIHQIYLFKYKK